MTEDEKMKLIQEGIRIGKEHRKMSPETATQTKLLEEKLNSVNTDVAEIKTTVNSILTAINKLLIWAIVSLIGMIGVVSATALSIGNWQGTINEKLSHLEQKNTELDIKIERIDSRK